MTSSLLLIDGHACAYRAFHAIRELRSPTGAPTNALFGFVHAVRRLLEAQRPKAKGQRLNLDFSLQPSAFSHVAVVWDGGLAAERVAAWPAYKAQRPPLPADLAAQLDGMGAWLGALGVASLCRDGVEADDWIAALARRAAGLGWTVRIASSDKDFLQLVTGDCGMGSAECGVRSAAGQGSEGSGVRGEVRGESGAAGSQLSLPTSHLPRGQIGLLRPGDATVWDAARVREKTGVGPGQIVDWLSLMGDAVDNIPGVPGVGPKTAAELLGRFGSVAGLYERLAEVKSERLRAALAAAAADVRRNQDLVRLPHAGFRLPGPASGAAPGEVRGQRTEDRGQRAEGRGQRAEDRGPTPDLGALTSDLRPLNGGLDELAVRAADVDALRGLYARWGFRGFLAALTPAGGGTDLKPVPGRDATAQATLL